MAGAGDAGALQGEQADGAAADDCGHVAHPKMTAAHPVEGHRGRLHHGAGVVAQVGRQLAQPVGGQRHGPGEPAVLRGPLAGVEALGHPAVLGQVGPALLAGAAAGSDPGRHPVALLHQGDPGADGGHRADPLVAADARGVVPALHVGVHVATADPAAVDLHHRLAGLGHRIGHLRQLEVPLASDHASSHRRRLTTGV